MEKYLQQLVGFAETCHFAFVILNVTTLACNINYYDRVIFSSNQFLAFFFLFEKRHIDQFEP